VARRVENFQIGDRQRHQHVIFVKRRTGEIVERDRVRRTAQRLPDRGLPVWPLREQYFHRQKTRPS